MFNLNKEDIKNKTEMLEDESKEFIEETSDKVKENTNRAANQVVRKTQTVKNEANDLVTNIKKLVNDYTDTSSVSEKAIELKDKVTYEAVNAYKTGREKTEKTIKEHPIATVALVTGASLMLGYILGTRKSSK
jgi:ElaB/YqjD/DUF883 family membrane-anchored ribosome-binding protein